MVVLKYGRVVLPLCVARLWRGFPPTAQRLSTVRVKLPGNIGYLHVPNYFVIMSGRQQRVMVQPIVSSISPIILQCDRFLNMFLLQNVIFKNLQQV